MIKLIGKVTTQFAIVTFTLSCGEGIERYQCQKLIQDGEFDQAIPRLSSLIEKYPEDAMLYSLRGIALINKENPDSINAFHDLSISIELLPNSPELYLNRATAYLRVKKTDDAILDCQKALAFAQSRTMKSMIHDLMGLNYLAKGLLQQAITHFDYSLALKPEGEMKAVVYANRGLAYGRLGEFETAFANIDNALSISKRIGYKQRGLVKMLQGDDIGAQRDFEKHLEYFPKYKYDLSDAKIRYEEFRKKTSNQ